MHAWQNLLMTDEILLLEQNGNSLDTIQRFSKCAMFFYSPLFVFFGGGGIHHLKFIPIVNSFRQLLCHIASRAIYHSVDKKYT